VFLKKKKKKRKKKLQIYQRQISTEEIYVLGLGTVNNTATVYGFADILPHSDKFVCANIMWQLATCLNLKRL